MAPRTKVYRMWTASDREWLRELATLHSSNKDIADIMERDESAVAFQRRALRIRLKGCKKGPQANPDRPKFVAPVEPHARIERMLRYAAMVAPRFSIADVKIVRESVEADSL